MIGLGALSIGAVGFKIANDSLINVVFGAIGLLAIMGAAFAIDGFMDAYDISSRDRATFLGGAYSIFAVVIAIMSPAIILVVVFANAVNSCDGNPDLDLCLTEATSLGWLGWLAIVLAGGSILVKLMTKDEPKKILFTGAVVVTHLYALGILLERYA